MEVRPLSGLHLGARLRETDDADDFRFTLIAGLTLGGADYHALPAYDRGGHATGTTFLVRAAAPHRSLAVPSALRPGRSPRWAAVNLENKVLTYQKYRWFDDTRVAWLDLARRLDRLRDAPDIAGVALNLAGLRPRPSLAWELRRKLGELRAAGKEVVVHADNLSLLDTWLATAGDRLTLDPQGSVILPGFASRRTYVRGTLAKLGVGFQELRFMPCKSAVEVFARDEMSDCEREQRQRMIDVAYETARDGDLRRAPPSPRPPSTAWSTRRSCSPPPPPAPPASSTVSVAGRTWWMSGSARSGTGAGQRPPPPRRINCPTSAGAARRRSRWCTPWASAPWTPASAVAPRPPTCAASFMITT